MTVRAIVTLALLAPCAAQQIDDEAVAARCRELAAAQDAGTLTVAAVLAALAGDSEPVARTAAAIVRHEWAELPPALFEGLDASPAAARLFLRELAQAPRPAARSWAHRRSAALPGRTLDDRCLALAARGTSITTAEADLLLTTIAAGEVDDGFYAALVVLPEPVADGLLGKLHQGLLQERFSIEQVAPLLDRMSGHGLRGLLGLLGSLPAATGAQLVAVLQERRPDVVREQAGAALDAAGPLDLLWVPYCAAALVRPERIARVRALLGDPAIAQAVQEQALSTLLEARIVDAALLAGAEALEDDQHARLHRLLDVAIDQLPSSVLLRWWDLDTDLAKRVVRALSRRTVLQPELEQRLVAELQQAGTADGDFCRPAAEALVSRSGPDGLQAVWPLLRVSAGWSEFLAAMVRRPEPFVHERLLEELQAQPEGIDPELRQQQLDAVALALAARGDRRELQRLLDRAPASTPGFVRRCAHHVRPLAGEQARSLLDRALAPESRVADAVAVELVAWAATAVGDAAVSARLRALWQEPPAVSFAEELQEVLLRALASSQYRGALVAELRAAIAAGPLPERLEPLTFELLASMAQPPSAADLELCAELVLLMPRTDPAREAHLAARWPDGSFGFPLMAAVAERLRTASPDLVAATFAAGAEQALSDPRHQVIAPSRLLVLWRELGVVPAVQQALARATAGLFLALPAQPGAGKGPGHWFAAHAAAAAGDFAVAREHAVRARNAFLRLPTERRHARLFLGDRDACAGLDPWAALAAFPHWLACQCDMARSDLAAAASAARLVREFAGHDLTLLADLPTSPPETAR